MLKLKLQYFGHLMQRTDSFEKILMLGKIKAGEEADNRDLMASPTQWTWVWVNSGSRWRTGRPGVLQSMGSQRVRHDWGTKLNWLSPCLFNLYAEYIMWNAGLDESQAGVKIDERNINNLRYADDTTLMAESEEELKNLLMKWKRRVKKLA